jgi:dihydroxy-acid dehydratase
MVAVFILEWKGESLNIVSAFEALGKIQPFHPKISKALFKNSCPGAGACGGMYTAYDVLSY